MKHYTHLSLEELQTIDYLLNKEKKSIREIAKELKRSPNTVARLINKYKRKPSWKEENEAEKGFKKILKGYTVFDWKYTDKERKEARKRCVKKKKLFLGGELLGIIILKLKDGWKPDVIAGRLKMNYPNEKKFHISKQTIYNFIYKNSHLGLYEYLRRGKKKPKKRTNKIHSKLIKNRVSIHERDSIVNDRARLGDIEVDSVIGKMGEIKTIINTMVDRKSRMFFASLVKDKTAYNTYLAMLKKIKEEIGLNKIKTITSDNGSEFALHTKFNELGIKTYFADTYSSYQRGTNERMNGMLRVFFPKKRDFSDITEKELLNIQNYLNNLPRKILGYKTPFEVWNA